MKPHLSLLQALSHQSARKTNRNTQLATRRHSSATFGTVHRNSFSLKLSHTPSLLVSLTLTAATAVDLEAAAGAAAKLFPSSHSRFQGEFIPLGSVFYFGLRILGEMRGGNKTFCTLERRSQRCVGLEPSGKISGKISFWQDMCMEIASLSLRLGFNRGNGVRI